MKNVGQSRYTDFRLVLASETAYLNIFNQAMYLSRLQVVNAVPAASYALQRISAAEKVQFFLKHWKRLVSFQSQKAELAKTN